MKELFRSILQPIVWFFDNIGSITYCGLIMVFLTSIEIFVFHIPSKYTDVIWIGNTIIALLVYLFAVNATKKEYEEKLDYFSLETVLRSIHGSATEEEIHLYETGLEEIINKYSGEEAFLKQKEFIVKQRVELILSKIKSY